MQIQWLGHSAFKVTAPGVQVLFDPFLNGNPSFAGRYEEVIAGTTHVLLTHAHNDHWGDTVDILQRTGALLVSSPEICDFIEMTHDNVRVHAMGIGGTRRFGDITVTAVRAVHSSAYNTADDRIIYGGTPMGLILTLKGKALYHMGDTDIFGDMALIEELYQPAIGLVPIGDNFTMGPRTAALAVNRYFNFETVVPCHYGTFPVLEQSAGAFGGLVEKAHVEVLAPMGSFKAKVAMGTMSAVRDVPTGYSSDRQGALPWTSSRCWRRLPLSRYMPSPQGPRSSSAWRCSSGARAMHHTAFSAGRGSP